MAFSRTNARTPATIGSITLLVADPDGQNTNRRIAATVEILDGNGDVMRV